MIVVTPVLDVAFLDDVLQRGSSETLRQTSSWAEVSSASSSKEP